MKIARGLVDRLFNWLTGGTGARGLRPKRLFGLLLPALGTIMLLVGAYDRFIVSDDIEQMDGAVNVAVPVFSASGSLDSGSLELAAARIAKNAATNQTNLLTGLAGEYGLLADSFLVWGPDEIKIKGSPGKIANDLLADIVIDATLEFDRDSSKVTPSFYFSGRKFIDSDAEELVGLHRLGPTVIARGPPDSAQAQATIDAALNVHWGIIAKVTLGLDYYGAGDVETAIELFQSAVKTADDNWEDRSGAEVFYLYLANALGRNGDIQEAHDAYEEALEINPGYARANVGLAETIFQLELLPSGICRSDLTDRAPIDRAIEMIEGARETSLSLPLTDLQHTKTSLLLGRMHLCLFLAEFESFQLSEGFLNSVFDSTKNLGDFGVRERSRWEDIAAESWATLAVMYSKSQPDQIDLQAEAYSNAIDLSAVFNKRALFYLTLASISLQTRDCTVARENIDAGVGITGFSNAPFRLRYERMQNEWETAGCSGLLPDLTF